MRGFADVIQVPSQLTLRYRGYLDGPNLITGVFEKQSFLRLVEQEKVKDMFSIRRIPHSGDGLKMEGATW